MLEYIGGVTSDSSKADYRINLTKNITNELNSTEYGSRSEVDRDGVLKRVRTLTTNHLIVMIINFKTSIQRELDKFFKDLSGADFNIRAVTKSAFTKARAKLNPWAFKRLNEVAVNTFYEDAPYHTWNGKRLLGVDGSRLALPNHPSIIKKFGQYEFGPSADSKRSLALGSALYDVLNLVVLDSQIAPYAGSERDLLIEHLPKIKSGDLLLLDRGYPCFWLLFLLTAMKVDFCVRLKEDWWLSVKDFSGSSETERTVKFKLPKKDFSKLSDYPTIQTTEISCRLVKVLLDTGETEILCTSLLDQKEYPHEVFKELYHQRWAEEEGYKLFKSRIEVERFSGKTALAVEQDFHAKMFLMTLTAAYAHPIEQRVVAEYKADKNRKHSQKINRTNALSASQSILIAIIFKKLIKTALAAFDDLVYKTREIIRPGRSNPRKHRQKKPYNMNYKPL